MNAFELGRHTADLFLGFSCFLREKAESEGLQTLYFCTREGQFFKAVYDSLFGREGLEPPIETRLLYVSRQSVFPASILSEDGPDFSHLFRLYKTHSARTLLSSLGIFDQQTVQFFEERGIDPDELARSPKQVKAQQSVLASEDFRAQVTERLAKQKALVKRYFQQEFGHLEKIGIVDIGWRATVLAALGRLFPDRQFVGLYLGLAKERNEFGANCSKDAFGPNFDQHGDYRDLLHAVDVLEFACLAATPSIFAYQIAAESTIVPLTEQNCDSFHELESFSSAFQRGVVSYAAHANMFAFESRYQSGELRRAAMHLWRGFLKRPNPELVRAFFSYQSDERFGLDEIRNQSMVPTVGELLLATVSCKARSELRKFLTYNQWAEGVLARRDLGYVKRRLLFALLKSAGIYKRLSQM